MAQIIDGKKIALEIQKDLARQIRRLKIQPGLAIVQVGANPASDIYVGLKKKSCVAVGIRCEIFKLLKSVTTKKIISLVQKLNFDKKIHGIIVQLPLPKNLNQEKIIESILPEKDADSLTAQNLGSLLKGKPRVVPATPQGIIKLIESTRKNLTGKKAVVVGRSVIVGKPLAQLLLTQNATVTICHRYTQNLAQETKQADILIVAVGKPRLIQASMVKKGAIVIDVGINRLGGKIVGDVDFASVSKKASFITPVPGGVGPMTVAMLLQNTFELAEKCLNEKT